ncbi:hypothetical protein E2C01_045003 [Portunus trituberculatus]|uniref:Uncharacterized protein n=1 Tax=Portunus trituberculatus TaxID=210409 RepID=A0A5B7G1N5_PORTR|nr:hypothetical protein [Portunus trituberculatus]
MKCSTPKKAACALESELAHNRERCSNGECKEWPLSLHLSFSNEGPEKGEPELQDQDWTCVGKTGCAACHQYYPWPKLKLGCLESTSLLTAPLWC